MFMDTVNTPTRRKKLLTLSAQDPGESRRRWQHVTEALARGDIDTASQAKHIVSACQPHYMLSSCVVQLWDIFVGSLCHQNALAYVALR